MARALELAFSQRPNMLVMGGKSVNHVAHMPVLADSDPLGVQQFIHSLVENGERALIGGAIVIGLLAIGAFVLGRRKAGSETDRTVRGWQEDERDRRRGNPWS